MSWYHPIILAFFVINHITIYCQEPASWHLTDEDGLPSQTVYQILQDQKGYIWMGTENGLARFDGKNFQIYSNDSLLDNEIINLQQDKWGKIWMGNINGQLGYLDNDSIKLATLPYSFEENIYRPSIIQDEYLWVMVTKRDHLYNVVDSLLKFIVFSIEENNAIVLDTIIEFAGVARSSLNITNAKSKQLFWYCTKDSFYLKEINKNTLSEIISWSFFEIPVLSHVVPLQDSFYLVYPPFNKVWHKTPNSYTPIYDLNPGFLNQTVIQDNRILFLTTSGMVSYSFSPNKQSTYKKIFQENSINNVAIDQMGDYWIATNANGIFMVPSLSIELTQKINSPLTRDEVSSINAINEKDLIIGQSNSTISIYSSGSITEIFNFFPKGKVTSLIKDKNNFYWMGTENYLFILNHNLTSTNCHIGNKSIKNIITDHEGFVWVAGSKVLRKFNAISKNNCSDLNMYSGEVILNQKVYGLLQDKSNIIWIGSTQGLYKYYAGEVTPFLERGVHRKYYINDIKQTFDSSIWVATSGDGLLRIKNDSIIQRFNEQTGFPASACTKIATLRNKVWIGTKKGVCQIEIGKESSIWINKKDGLPSNEITALHANEKDLWIGTPKGLIRFPQNEIQENKVAPPIYITSLKISNKDTTQHPSYELSYTQNILEISFLGFAYRTKGDIDYSYRLKGLTDQWTITKERVARYFSLSPGNYTFEVLAYNEDGVPSQSATISFLIHPPWWKTMWFQIGGILFLMSITGGIVYWRSGDLRKREKAEHALRERINNLRMEALQTQMNPHFIFNSLNAIQDFLVTNDQPSAIHYLSKFANMIRQIFDQSRKKKISMEEELEFLELYLALEKLRFGEKVAIEFEVTETIRENAADILIPPLLIQPIIENAFKHGLLHKKKNGKLNIRIKSHPKYQLHCIVEDNGVGRKRAEQLNKWRNKNRKSTGLAATQERLKLLHGDHSNSLIIHDLTDSTNKACGTKIELFV